MGGFATHEHVAAIALSLLLVLGVRVQETDLQPLLGPFEDAQLGVHSYDFPGIKELQRHELFAAQHRAKKKILVLGASNMHSIGADRSWSHADPTRLPTRNVDYSCSISYHLNLLLKERGYIEWECFSLALNGSQLTSNMVCLARAIEVKPEIVIYGDSYTDFAKKNAGFANMTSAQLAFCSETYGAIPRSEASWSKLLTHIRAKGTKPSPAHDDLTNYTTPTAGARDATSAVDLVSWLFRKLRRLEIVEGPPLPPKIYDDFALGSPSPDWDPSMSYHEGLVAMKELQERSGGVFAFCYLPTLNNRGASFQQGLEEKTLPWFERRGIPVIDLGALPLKKPLEMYDDIHGTFYGNRKTAAGLFAALETRGFLAR